MMTSQFTSRRHTNFLPEFVRQVDSASQSANCDDHQQQSMNPFRQYSGTSNPTTPIPRSVSQESEKSAKGVRKKTPIRAVFDDLPTAHSSITSGSVRSRVLVVSNNLSEAHNDEVCSEDSIPLRVIEQPIQKNNDAASFLPNLPLPPPPAVLSQCRHSSHSNQSQQCLVTEDDNLASGQRAKLLPPIQPRVHGQTSSVLANIRSALASSSPPADASTPSHWPRDNLDRDDDGKCQGLVLRKKYLDYSGFQVNQSTPNVSTPHVNSNAGKQTNPRSRCSGNSSSTYPSSLVAAPLLFLALGKRKYEDEATNQCVNLHNGSRKIFGYGSHCEGTHFPDLQSSSAVNEESPALPGPFSKTGELSNDGSSLPDASTVGDIYRHYVRSDGPDDARSNSDGGNSEYELPNMHPIHRDCSTRHASNLGLSSSSISEEKFQPSALNVRKHVRAERFVLKSHGQPPRYALPSIPSSAAHHIIPSSTSQGIGCSSSYGDTHNLLEMEQRSPWIAHKPILNRSNARNDLRCDQTLSEMGGSEPSISNLNCNNPFQVNHGPQVNIHQPTGDDCIYDGGTDYNYIMAERQPLEREVSEALRRASGFSTYSNGSITSLLLERYEGFQSEASISKGIELPRRSLSELECVNENARTADARVKAFYDESAIAPSWIKARRQNVVRVPILHNGSFPDSPPDSPQDLIDLPFGSRTRGTPNEGYEEANDWETVGESALGTEFKSSKDTPGMLGGTAHRAGSSLANTSDEGTASTHLPEIDKYGSTERIAQHPGNIQYFGDYRQRDLKKIRIPIFLPVFREHKVNGYLADSTRIRPLANPFNCNPRPLNRSHTNPFKSPPPEVMTVPGTKYSIPASHNQRGPKLNHFPPSMKTLTTTEESNNTEQSAAPGLTMRPTTAVERSSQTLNWMDEFGEPGPAISYQNKQFLSACTQDRPTSWQHVMILADGGYIHGYNPDGSQIVDHGFKEITSSGNKISTGKELQGKTETNGFVEAQNYEGKKGSASSRDHTQLVRGPPGAFYKGLSRSRPDSKQASWSNDRERAAKLPVRQNSTKDYPTNTLRPLSLLASLQSTPAVDSAGRDRSGDIRQNDFIYRSPLAPPKRASWQKLYSKSQLQGIREAAKADGIYDTQVLPTAGLLRDSTKEGGSRKHLWESPRLFAWSRDTSACTDLSRSKSQISTTVLCLCNLFPPLLFLYAIGRLDGIMLWWTSGESSTFGKGQKRCAYILMCSWGLAIFVGLLIFLVYWFTAWHS